MMRLHALRTPGINPPGRRLSYTIMFAE